MGRHSSFNKQQVLADALDLFWARGYASTSLKQLEDVTEMHPGSLYYHFKNKEQLYLACLQYYFDWFFKPKIEQYLKYTTTTEGLRRFFTSGYRHHKDLAFRNSCFLVAASHELHLLPEEARQLIRHGLESLRVHFNEHLIQAIEHNKIPNHPATDVLAGELVNLYLSVQLQARIIPNQHHLDSQVKHSLNNILQLQHPNSKNG